MLQILVVKARLLRGKWLRALTVLAGGALGAALAFGRARGHAPVTVPLSPAPRALTPRSAAVPPPTPAEVDAERACRAESEALLAVKPLALPPSASPELRAQLLGRTKNVPVLFLSRPEPAANNPAAAALRQSLEAAPGYATFDTVVGKVRKTPELARAVFLRDGYLYTENPELAALYGSLTLSLLFRDPELTIVRGAEQLSARRLEDGDYEYTSGDDRGRRAKLLLFDRIFAAGSEASPARHLDLRTAAQELGFDELVVRHATAQQLLVDAVYAGVKVPTLLRVTGSQASLSCEAPGREREHVLSYRAQAERAREAQARLLSAVKEQVDEALPFDEPKTEDGQQDGKLRPEWRNAYFNGSSSFEFNGDKYSVFDGAGRPRPPQVCIDFVLDTFERAGGSWWQPRSLPRQRVVGRLAFDDPALENRRSVESFLDFARDHERDFDVYDVPADERVPLRNREQFFSALYRSRAEFRRGDIVAILGPRDDEKLHYHSFLIVAADPLSGMPTELAANAGRPRIRSWEGEMQNAPRRSILARVRPRMVWLEALLAERGLSAADAAPSGPNAKSPASG
jgi:hypothetical protein